MATSPVSEILRHLRGVELLRELERQSDAELLAAFVRRREAAALDALVRRHGPMVWGVCRRVLDNHHDAEDAFQATFLVFVRKAASVRSPERFGNWLYGVAHQAARKARQAAAKRHARERQVAAMPEPNLVPEDRDLGPDVLLVLDEELSRLPDKYRAVIVLCQLEGKGRPEAARQLGLPEGTVGSRLARARVLLAKRPARRGLTVTAAALAAGLSRQAASASVPAAVLSKTLQGAALLAAGEAAAAGVIPTQVSPLTEGVLKAMLVTNLKTTVLAVLAAAGAVLVAGALTRHLLAAEKGPPRDGARPAHAAGAGPQDAPKDGNRAFRLAEGGGVHAAVLSPDGTTLVASTIVLPVAMKDVLAGQPDKVITKLQVLDAATGKSRRAIDLGGDQATSLAFTPDGRAVVVSTYMNRSKTQTVRLWDITTGKEVRRFAGEQGTSDQGQSILLYGIALSKDGRTLAVSSGGVDTKKGGDLPGEVRLWDVQTGKELARLKGHTKMAIRAAFARDGVTLASGSRDHTVRIWDAKARKEIRKLDHGEVVEGLAFSPDGKLVASIGHDGPNRLVVWDVTTGKQVRELPGGRCVAFSPDGTLLASGGDDKTVHLWDASTGKEVASFSGPTNSVAWAGFSRDGKTLVTGGPGDDTVRLWAVPRAGKEGTSR
jgi:RNA polymerase sigma factor (sigma-70 family)